MVIIFVLEGKSVAGLVYGLQIVPVNPIAVGLGWTLMGFDLISPLLGQKEFCLFLQYGLIGKLCHLTDLGHLGSFKYSLLLMSASQVVNGDLDVSKHTV